MQHRLRKHLFTSPVLLIQFPLDSGGQTDKHWIISACYFCSICVCHIGLKWEVKDVLYPIILSRCKALESTSFVASWVVTSLHWERDKGSCSDVRELFLISLSLSFSQTECYHKHKDCLKMLQQRFSVGSSWVVSVHNTQVFLTGKSEVDFSNKSRWNI